MKGSGSLTALILRATIVSSCVVCALAEQVPLSTTLDPKLDLKAVERDAFFIFNSVHHLVRQWGTVFTPNGFSCTQGTIPFGTNLFHGRLVCSSWVVTQYARLIPSLTLFLCLHSLESAYDEEC